MNSSYPVPSRATAVKEPRGTSAVVAARKLMEVADVSQAGTIVADNTAKELAIPTGAVVISVLALDQPFCIKVQRKPDPAQRAADDSAVGAEADLAAPLPADCLHFVAAGERREFVVYDDNKVFLTRSGGVSATVHYSFEV